MKDAETTAHIVLVTGVSQEVGARLFAFENGRRARDSFTRIALSSWKFRATRGRIQTHAEIGHGDFGSRDPEAGGMRPLEREAFEFAVTRCFTVRAVVGWN